MNLNREFSERRNKNSKEISFIVLIIPNNERNLYRSNLEVSSHPSQNGSNSGEDVSKAEPSVIDGSIRNWSSHIVNQCVELSTSSTPGHLTI